MIDAEDIKELVDTSDRLVASVSTDFHRYLSSEIDWSGRLICIKGASGTGKTTLMQQRLKESFGVGGKGVYVSLDDLWLSPPLIQRCQDIPSSYVPYDKKDKPQEVKTYEVKEFMPVWFINDNKYMWH